MTLQLYVFRFSLCIGFHLRINAQYKALTLGFLFLHSPYYDGNFIHLQIVTYYVSRNSMYRGIFLAK